MPILSSFALFVILQTASRWIATGHSPNFGRTVENLMSGRAKRYMSSNGNNPAAASDAMSQRREN
jgi:hypothetical protein